MAHIFKKPTAQSKGIIVFTHKELALYFQMEQRGWKRVLYYSIRKLDFSYYSLRANFLKFWPLMKKSYFVGVHIGGHISTAYFLDQVDFIMTPGGNLKGYTGSTPRTFLASRNFIPDSYKDLGLGKFWDFINISRAGKVKELESFLKSVRKIYDIGERKRVLLVVASAVDESGDTYYSDLMKDYYTMFSSEEREYFCILKLSHELRFPGLPTPTINYLMSTSHVLALFSRSEGGSKVVSEALACGLKVCVFKDLKGGGLDMLNPTNSTLFASYDTAHEALLACLRLEVTEEQKKASRNSVVASECIKELKVFLGEIYRKAGLEFDGELINLDRLQQRLPAHLNQDLPWANGLNETADVFTNDQFRLFCNELGLSV